MTFDDGRGSDGYFQEEKPKEQPLAFDKEAPPTQVMQTHLSELTENQVLPLFCTLFCQCNKYRHCWTCRQINRL